MYVLHIYLLTICLAIVRVSFGYEVINNEIIERIDLDNAQDLQQLTTLVKTQTPKISHHVDKSPSNGDEPNSVQTYHDTVGVSSNQPSIIYAAIQATPLVRTQDNDQTKDASVTILEETSETPMENKKSQSKVEDNSSVKKPSSKLEDPNEDKTKNIKAKLITHLKQTLPKLYSMLSVEMQNKHDNNQELTSEYKKEESTQETVTRLKPVNIQPYATIIDDDKDLKAEQSEDNYPYVVYDKQDYLKPKSVKKTVKTHKIGDEKKNVYPKEEVKSFEYKKADDLETDNTIWIGYGLGVPYRYPYPYNYPSSVYSYGRPYSGWGTRGYTGGPSYYGGYLDRTGLGYYNNHGTGYGPYGGYL
uniref:Uncharacterized protein n=1 Tax=Cacopsylla melanoneura TaxID=428564 RepID=A0A8D9B1D2_9HEMI